MKLFDSELHVMEILWKEGDTTAKRIAELTKERVGWSKTTTYTVIKRCVEKGAIARIEPNFICRPLVTQAQAQEYETQELIDKLYGGAADRLVSALLEGKKLSQEEIQRLRQLVDQLE